MVAVAAILFLCKLGRKASHHRAFISEMICMVLMNIPTKLNISTTVAGGRAAGERLVSAWSRQLGPQQRVLNAGTHQLSEAVKSHVFTG